MITLRLLVFCMLLLLYLLGLTAGTIDLSGPWSLEAPVPNSLKPTILNFITDPLTTAELRKTGYLRTNGTVPGYIIWDLYQNKIIPHPLHSDNDVRLRPLSLLTWTYSKTVRIPADASGTVKLVFDGLDTITNIFVNKQFLVSTNNMFVGDIELDISRFINSGEVFVQVMILSAVNEAEAKAASYPHIVPPTEYPAVQHGERYRNFVRKSPASFSWDWGPAFAAQGIWRGARIEYGKEFKVISYRINTGTSTTCNTSMETVWYFTAIVEIGYKGNLPFVSATIPDTLPTNINTSIKLTKDILEFHYSAQVSRISPWFPVGYGKPTLYQFKIDLCSIKDLKDCQTFTKPFGFREVYLNQSSVGEADEENLSWFSSGQLDEKNKLFEFVINNVQVYIKGANLVPLSVFETDSTSIDDVFRMVELGNVNTLRVWGGGVYHSDTFYDEADRRGIMIWQEFMFACSLYPTDHDFLNSVSAEVLYQVNRLRNHPSIILFSGNNENKQGLQQNWYNTDSEKIYYVSEYQKLYDHTVRAIVEKQTDLPFLLSSPSNGESSGWVDDNPQSELAGDVHYYNYNDNCLDTSHLPIPRFASEFGFQSYPSLDTLREALPDVESFDLFNKALEHRQHLVNGNSLLLHQVQRLFNVKWLKDQALVYLSQLHQYLCVTAQVFQPIMLT